MAPELLEGVVLPLCAFTLGIREPSLPGPPPGPLFGRRKAKEVGRKGATPAAFHLRGLGPFWQELDLPVMGQDLDWESHHQCTSSGRPELPAAESCALRNAGPEVKPAPTPSKSLPAAQRGSTGMQLKGLGPKGEKKMSKEALYLSHNM